MAIGALGARHPLLREVILENFMSYSYARVPFKPGVNVICGPNGAGKSSILLAISVALGQSYTERSRKLSDLIRWGEKRARVTLILDNSKKNGRRPAPRFDQEEISLARYIDRGGRYWFEINDRLAKKKDIVRLLSRFGVDPENMLIIMHQDMIGEFIVLSPRDKLWMMEAAIGFESYRKHLLVARKRLEKIVGKERSLKTILNKAKETLDYWKKQYERFKEKRRSALRLRFLQRALAWEQADEQEKVLIEFDKRIKENEQQASIYRREADQITDKLGQVYNELPILKTRRRDLLNEHLKKEREKASSEVRLSYAEETIKDIQNYLRHLEKETDLLSNRSIRIIHESLSKRLKESRQLAPKLEAKIADAKKTSSQLQADLTKLESRIEKLNDEVLDRKVRLAVLHYKIKAQDEDLRKLKTRHQVSLQKFKLLTTKARALGPKALVGMKPEAIADEISLMRGKLSSLADVSDKAETMYENYAKNYNEIAWKAESVATNRRLLLDEINLRTKAWRKVIQGVIKRVDSRYQTILSQIGAIGKVGPVKMEDIENVGIQLFVGFKGAKMMPLTAYTQSGGEKSMATMVFLLALQQYIKSPFRAVDEYDVHMDPTNREMIFRHALRSLAGQEAQYLMITPGRIPVFDKDIHVLTVQASEGGSIIQGVE